MAKLDPTLQKMLDDILMERTEMILDFDRNLIVGLIAAIPAGNLLAHMPIPATLTTMTELIDARKLLTTAYEGGPYWQVGTFTTWKELPAGPAAAATPKTKTEQAEEMLVAFVRLFPHALSFGYLNPDAFAPGVAAKRLEHNLGMQKPHPTFATSTNSTQRLFLEEYKAAAVNGSTASLKECMTPAAQIEVRNQLSKAFSAECEAWFEKPVSSIEEGDYIRFFLLMAANPSKADKKDIFDSFKDACVTDDSAEAFRKYDTNFHHERELLIDGKADPLPAKRWAELHAGGLTAPVRSFAIDLAKAVDSSFLKQYYLPLLDHVEELRTSETHVDGLKK